MWITLIMTILCPTIGRVSPSDIDWRTIITLFNLMVCLQLLQYLGILNYISIKLAAATNNARQLIQLLCLTSFISSMLLTNDVAILTLISIYLSLVRKHQLPIAYPVTLITISANLGSAFTPFGNPQNLIIFNTYKLSLTSFLQLSWPLTVAGITLLIISTFFIKNKPLKYNNRQLPEVKYHQLWLPLIALIVVFLAIFRVIPIGWAAGLAIISTLIVNRSSLFSVDYGILITFCGFFLIIGCLSRTPLISHVVYISTQSPAAVYFSGLLLSQFFSNVPTTMLLSPHTSSITALFLGVNIGGLGTLVASLANLLAIKQSKLNGVASDKKFFIVFIGINFLFLAILGIVGWLLFSG